MSISNITPYQLFFTNINERIEERREEFEERIVRFRLRDSSNQIIPTPTKWEAYTPFQRAAAVGRLEDVKNLGQLGFKDFVSYDYRVNGMAAWQLALSFRRPEIVKFLFPTSAYQEGILHMLSASNDQLFQELWVQASPEVRCNVVAAVAKDKPTLLPIAQKVTIYSSILYSDLNIFKELWQMASLEIKGAFCKVKNTRDEFLEVSWIELAVYVGRCDIIEYLLDGDYNVKITNPKGSTPLTTAYENLKKIDNALLTKFIEKDGGFTDDIELCKIFGHRFSLEGSHFEGFVISRKQILIDQMLESLSKISQFSNLGRFASSRILDIKEAFRHSDSAPEIGFERSLKTWSIVTSGWHGHSTSSLFMNQICVKIDTGTGSNRGIKFYKIQNHDQEIIKKAMTTLINNCKQQVSSDIGAIYFHETIDEELNLELFAWLPFEQKVGNCVWSSYKAALLTLMILQEVTQTSGLLDKDTLQKVYNILLNDFVMWESLDRTWSLEPAILVMIKHPKIFDIETILSKVLEQDFDDQKTVSLRRACVKLLDSV